MKQKNGFLTAMIFLAICVFGFDAGKAAGKEFSGVDPRIFNKSGFVEITKADKEIVSPGRKWKWLNNWHLVRLQQGFLGTGSNASAYTVSRSVNKAFMNTYPWPFYCYFLYQGPELPEKYDGGVRDMEKLIKNKRGHSANVSRIDKLRPGVYVVTYVRSPASYKAFELREVDFPPFHLASKIFAADSGFITPVSVKSLDPYGRDIAGYQNMELAIDGIILLNPDFFNNPTELDNVSIPYNFFDQGLVYEHPEVRRRATDPMIIEIGDQGITLRYRKSANIPKL